jgi:PAS domain-containing protein
LVFLGVGLLVWIIVAVLLVIFLQHGISGPTRKLDEKALELLRGGTVPEAQWDRIHAETSAPLGGHADCMLDLARYVDHQRLSLRDMTSRFGGLFNSLPSPAFMLDRTHRIVDVNEAMVLATGRDSQWLIGQHVSVLEAWIMTGTLIRWLDRTSTSAVGLRRVPCSWITRSTDENGQENDDRKAFLTVSPAPVGDGPGHIVLVEGWASTLLEEPGTVSVVSQATFDDGNALVQDGAAAPYVGQIPSLISSAFRDYGPAGGDGRYGTSREAAWPNPAEDLSLRPSMRSGDEVSAG